ncbi:hypothetical protein F4V91_21055 [Neorhizobium galegae]|uniref:Uncharacterized protein n=1 Tax=Neorhizobium galegae TaxID=399 RepID=A0A6A1U0N0_NEOGA|nr:hypothetical protein [Neorhizobium galegae]KAB1088667.1 hypothetical protein F4V91_21055 [Neorhizobium galegae]
MSTELEILVENAGVVETMRQLLEAQDKFKTSRSAVEQRFSVVSSFLLMPTRRAKDLYKMVSAVAALGDIVRSPDEKLDRIADGSVSDSERATGLARLSTCIAGAGIIVALEQAIASPALFGLTEAEIAYKLQNIKRVMAIPDGAIGTVHTLETALGRLTPEERESSRR